MFWLFGFKITAAITCQIHILENFKVNMFINGFNFTLEKIKFDYKT